MEYEHCGAFMFSGFLLHGGPTNHHLHGFILATSTEILKQNNAKSICNEKLVVFGQQQQNYRIST